MNDIKIPGALSNYILSQTLSYFNCILDKSTLVVSFSLLPAVFKSKVKSAKIKLVNSKNNINVWIYN